MSVAYNEVKAIVAGIADRNYDRVYVGITGATNPIVASLFQATMAYLSSEVIPIYVQGRGTLSVRSFVASDVRDRVVAEEALSVARSGQIRVAARLAERLKSEEDWQFLASSLNALALWDDFDYEQAHKGLDPLEHRAAVLRSHPLLAAVAETTSRLAEAAGKMFALAKDIRNDQKFAETVGKPDWRSNGPGNGPVTRGRRPCKRSATRRRRPVHRCRTTRLSGRRMRDSNEVTRYWNSSAASRRLPARLSALFVGGSYQGSSCI